jgi:hypothetical protein
MEKKTMNGQRVLCGAALVLLVATGAADAAWNNAFQVTCFGARNRANRYYTPPVVAQSSPIVAYSAPAVDPCNCCQTSYVQRCYYQPVVTYKTVLEPVQSQRTTYYWEPVCSQRTSCYVDPCTGATIQVTQPVTTYRLRSQCSTVTNYVQRCVPVTTYRVAYRLEPVTVCPPGVTAPAGNVTETPPANGNYIPNPSVPPAEPGRVTEAPAQPESYQRPAAIRMDKVVSREPSARVQGQVVANNYVSPVRHAKVLFVNEHQESAKVDTAADAAGRFSVNLPSGSWRIYLSSRDGTLHYHSKIDVQPNKDRNVLVVSR